MFFRPGPHSSGWSCLSHIQEEFSNPRTQKKTSVDCSRGCGPLYFTTQHIKIKPCNLCQRKNSIDSTCLQEITQDIQIALI